MRAATLSHWRAVALLVLAAQAWPGVAVAKPKPPAPASREAAQLREEGNRAMDSGRPADALELYRRSYASSPDPALLYNQARAHQALTDYVEALDLLERFRAEAPPALLAKVDGLDALAAELEGRIHTLSFAGAPQGTELRVGGRIVGTVPLPAPLRLRAGEVVVEARCPGYSPKELRLTLEGGKSSTVEVALTQLVATGVVVVRASVAGATAVVDGVHQGGTPFEVTVDPGAHDVLVTKDGFEPAHGRVIVSAGERREATLVLESKPTILSRWWFWTAAGLVVAGGAVTYVALTTERPAPAGSIAPGQISVRGFRF